MDSCSQTITKINKAEVDYSVHIMKDNLTPSLCEVVRGIEETLSEVNMKNYGEESEDFLRFIVETHYGSSLHISVDIDYGIRTSQMVGIDEDLQIE